MKRLVAAGFLFLLPGLLQAAGASPGAVFVGRDIAIDQPVAGRVVVVGGHLRVSAPIAGDVVSWGAPVTVLPAGSIGGRLVMFGGSFTGSPASVAGGLLTPGSLAAVYLAEVRRSPLALPEAGERLTLLALRLLVLAGWLVLATALLIWRPTALVRAAIAGETDAGRSSLAGLLTILVLFAGAVAALAALPSLLRVIVAAAIALLAASLKVFGMAALFLMIGQRILARPEPRSRPAALATGLAVLGAISIFPVLGPLVWSAASIYGVGIAVLTRFGAPRFRVAVA